MSKSKQPLNLKDTLIAKLEKKLETIPEGTEGRVRTMANITGEIEKLRRDGVNETSMKDIMKKYRIELDNELIIDDIPSPTKEGSIHIDKNSPRPKRRVKERVAHDSLATRIKKRREDVKVKGTNKKLSCILMHL